MRTGPGLEPPRPFHRPAGTGGTEVDEGASAAPDHAVRGAEALGVSGVSVLPRRIAPITGAAALMTREKAADLTGIVGAWRLRGRLAVRLRTAAEDAAGASATKNAPSLPEPVARLNVDRHRRAGRPGRWNGKPGTRPPCNAAPAR